ncbi:MAG: porin, partial [Alphaproteobacteria bacterium]
MKLKSLLYGTAAVLMGAGASGGALAADPPMAAEPVEYVRICDAFGSGFFYIPGTDTCLRISGRVRIDAYVKGESDDDKDFNQFTSRARGYIRNDARTQTDLGLLRSFVAVYWTYGPSGVNTSNYDLSYSLGTTLDEAFISLSNDAGQWTFGKTASFFDFFGGYTYTGNGGFDQTTDAILWAYTFNMGNGVSGTLSLEDPYGSGRKNTEGSATNTVAGPLIAPLLDPSVTGFYSTGVAYGGQNIPDIVANLRVDQGWGSAQIMGALRQIRGKETGAFTDLETVNNIVVTP